MTDRQHQNSNGTAQRARKQCSQVIAITIQTTGNDNIDDKTDCDTFENDKHKQKQLVIFVRYNENQNVLLQYDSRTEM